MNMDWYGMTYTQQEPCANCFKKEGFMSSGFTPNVCSRTCQTRLDQRLASGMLTLREIEDRYRKLGFFVWISGCEPKQALRNQIKLLKHRIKKME